MHTTLRPPTSCPNLTITLQLLDVHWIDPHPLSVRDQGSCTKSAWISNFYFLSQTFLNPLSVSYEAFQYALHSCLHHVEGQCCGDVDLLHGAPCPRYQVIAIHDHLLTDPQLQVLVTNSATSIPL